ncbi:MAG: hypothetical protein AAGK17_07605 [Pseudomonadota bacterium]
MSERDPSTDPIGRGSDGDAALTRVLDAYRAPELSAGFADRVLASTADRAAPLPSARPAQQGRWRSARRLVIGAAAFGALATTAAATGLLDDLPIDLPSGEQVWATITGNPTPQAAPPPQRAAPAAIPPTVPMAERTIEGPIDSPEELEEAFKQIDERRSNRRETRQSNVDNRIDRMIERRRNEGRPVPSAEREERMKERLERARSRREENQTQRLEERRDALRERVEQGEELSPEDILREEREALGVDRLRGRRDELRSLSPEERRERLKQFRERRQERREQRLNDPQNEADAAPNAQELDEPAALENELSEPAPPDSPTEIF